MSQDFKHITKYLQMDGRILKPYTVNIKKKTVVNFVLPLCFTNPKKIVEFLILGKERDNTEKFKISSVQLRTST
jgi:hypothetical protein